MLIQYTSYIIYNGNIIQANLWRNTRIEMENCIAIMKEYDYKQQP